jgi:hypothetical protein
VKPSTQQRKYRPLQWLDTGGGPYVLVRQADLGAWGGIRSNGGVSDFARACDVDDYIGIIDLDEDRALVLGDDPFPTAFMPAPALGGGYFLRWLWGDDEEDAVSAVHRLRPEDWTAEDLVFDAGDGRLSLFDSVHPGESAPRRLDIRMGPGRYAVATANVQPHPNLCLMVHRFIPLQ